MSPEGRSVRCERCGAPLPLIGSRSLRCPFCLHRQEPPPAVAGALEQSSALASAYEAALADVEASSAEQRRRTSRYVLALAGFAGLVVLGLSSVALVQLSAGDPRGAFGLFAFALFAAMVGVVVRAFRESQRYGASLRLAQLPCASTAFVGDAFRASCPGCGATTEPEGITPTCGHCGTAFLLPLPLVDQAHRRMHQQIVAIRIGGAPSNATEIAMAANARYQATVKKMIRVVSVTFFVGLAVWLAYAHLAQP